MMALTKSSVRIVLFSVICLGTASLWFWLGSSDQKTAPVPTILVQLSSLVSFDECARAGYPIAESEPRQCFAEGKVFVDAPAEIITYTNATSDMVVVETPLPGAVTRETFSIIGKARGTWFFEASFPVEVIDKHGVVLAQGIAQAQSEWMTTDFVPFKADVQIPDAYIGKATLILKKDNPSDMSEHDASISFPITIE